MVAASEIISKPRSCRRFLRSGLRNFRAETNDQGSRITDHYENAEVGSERLEASGIAALPCPSNSQLLTSSFSLSYDYKRLLCETDAVGGAISQTYASDTTEEFGDLIGEDGQYIHQYDAQANTNALLDDTGTVQAQYKYFAFGQVSAVSIDGGPWTAEGWQSLPLDFTSNMLAGGKKQYYLDQEIALYLLGSGNNGRYYDATTGRFLSEDPTGEAGGDENLYRYTGDDPVNNLDPSGHDTKRTHHPPQTQPAQNPNSNVHPTTTPITKGTTKQGHAPPQPAAKPQIATAYPEPTPPPGSKPAAQTARTGAQQSGLTIGLDPTMPIPWGYMGAESMPEPAYQALTHRIGAALNSLQGPANAVLTMAQTEPPQEREPTDIAGGVLKGVADSGKAIEDAVPAANNTAGTVVKGVEDVGTKAVHPNLVPEATAGAKAAEQTAKSAMEDVPKGVLKNEGRQADLLKTQQSDLKEAIERGGARAKGKVLQEQGREAEDITRSTLKQVPGADVLKNQSVGKGVGSEVDSLVVRGHKSVYVETKLTIAKATQRLTNQLKNAVGKAGKTGGSVILQVARQPSAKEIAQLQKALGKAVFNRVKIVSTQIDLFKAVEAALK